MVALFTSESVSEGHPDKVADQISDAIIDAFLAQDPMSKVACESFVTTGQVVIGGEVRSNAYVDVQKIVRQTIRRIGYTKSEYQFDASSCSVLSAIHEQSSDIAQGVDVSQDHEQGAGDQGLMFGFACNETPELMPLPIQLAQKLSYRLSKLRKDKTLTWLKPDGKSQVSVEYENDKPVKVTSVVIATQHENLLGKFKTEKAEHQFITDNITKHVIIPVLDEYNIDYDDNFIVNGTGRFVIGGPLADTGLTGRKIIVDTYGGAAPHGGGAFSGKDPTKVDRSAAYASRYIAKNVVASKIADKCLIQLAYAIGVSKPLSIYVDLFDGDLEKHKFVEEKIKENFDLSPRGIREMLSLNKPIYEKTAAYGHFGRAPESDGAFSWENIDKTKVFSK